MCCVFFFFFFFQAEDGIRDKLVTGVQTCALPICRGVDYAFEVIGLPKTMRQAYDCLAKRGVCVVVGVAPMAMEISVPVMTLVYEERVLTGSVYGSSRPAIDIPKLIALYRAGKLKLDELLTRTYPFTEINEAYAALERGEVARSVVTFLALPSGPRPGRSFRRAPGV